MTTISAQVMEDSQSAVSGIRLVSLQLRYPLVIHAELMTHRVFSRNARSSRAVPVSRLLAEVELDPFVPLEWGKNQRGMQGGADHAELVSRPTPSGGCTDVSREDAWLYARDRAVELARAFAQAGYHKQLVNRLLAPFAHIDVLVSSTEWDNFFELRCHEAAEPHMRRLASEILAAIRNSSPTILHPGEWHLPYVTSLERADLHHRVVGVETLIQVSTARCARVSYQAHDGRSTSLEADLELYRKLVGARPLHASPAEHQATPDGLLEDSRWQNPKLHGNFVGWCQHRKLLEENL